jgi:hypothetical protein
VYISLIEKTVFNLVATVLTEVCTPSQNAREPQKWIDGFDERNDELKP